VWIYANRTTIVVRKMEISKISIYGIYIVKYRCRVGCRLLTTVNQAILARLFSICTWICFFSQHLQLPTFQIWLTPRKTNMSLEINGWNMYFLLKSSVFGDILVRFQGCMTWEGSTKTTDLTMHGNDSAVRFPWWTWSEAQMPVLSDLTGNS